MTSKFLKRGTPSPAAPTPHCFYPVRARKALSRIHRLAAGDQGALWVGWALIWARPASPNAWRLGSKCSAQPRDTRALWGCVGLQ